MGARISIELIEVMLPRVACASAIGANLASIRETILERSETLPNDVSIVIVTGPPRSGTTLLAGLLSGGPAYPMLPECTLITNAIRVYHQIRTTVDPVRKAAYIGDWDFLADLYGQLVSRMASRAIALLGGETKRFLVLKDPELTPYIGVLRVLFGRPLRTVCIVRDPRDIIASLVRVRGIVPEKLSAAELSALIRETFGHFFNIYTATNNQQPDNPVHIVRYEDLVQREEATFNRLERFVGYEIGREAFREVAYEFSPEDPFYSPYYGGRIVSRPVGRASRSFSPASLNLIESEFAGVMQYYSYQSSDRTD